MHVHSMVRIARQAYQGIAVEKAPLHMTPLQVTDLLREGITQMHPVHKARLRMMESFPAAASKGGMPTRLVWLLATTQVVMTRTD